MEINGYNIRNDTMREGFPFWKLCIKGLRVLEALLFVCFFFLYFCPVNERKRRMDKGWVKLLLSRKRRKRIHAHLMKTVFFNDTSSEQKKKQKHLKACSKQRRK